ncbi:hypothetical protein B0H13DRAFT_2463640 [Mycena leptocephala]|nr:hypothetical protein B0H13DRAFT_2463640 [Mycena leptocephala]
MAALEIDDDKPFIADDWIGKGKEYSDVPWEVIQAKNAVFALPPPVAGRLGIPAKNVPVTRFAALALPRQSSELAYGESQLWFSHDDAITDIGFLEDRTRNIPPRAVLDLLTRKAGQAWLNGAKSITDPRYNDGTDRFPLRVLTFWTEMANANEHKKCKDEHTRVAIDEARTALKTLGWSAPLIFGKEKTSTAYLQQFLGTVWLSTDCIDIMMEGLSARVESDPELADVAVATLSFARDLLASKRKKTGLLDRYEREVKEGKKRRLVFPANVGNSHWVGGLTDFTKKTVGFGDSLPGFFEPPKKLIKALKQWTKLKFGEEFHCDYNALEHGIQKDGYICGIVMFNTGGALYPNTPLWIPRSAVLSRIQHFLKYSKNQEKETTPTSTSTARTKMSIAELLNPRNMSSDSVASSDNSETGSSDFSDADVLLGRATWDDGSEDDSGMIGAGQDDDVSDHLTTSSGADWDAMSGSAMDVDAGGFEQHQPGEAALESEERSVMELDVAAGPSGGGEKPEDAMPRVKPKPKKQSSLFSFFRGTGSSESQPKEPAPSGGKRRRAGSDVSGGSAAKAVPTKKKPKKERAPPAPNEGSSRFAKWARLANEQVRNGTFEVDPAKYDSWKSKILKKDPHAEFDSNNVTLVRHSKCATVVKIKNPYDTTRFTQHIDKDCPILHRGAGMSILNANMFQPGNKPQQPAPAASQGTAGVKPCPGITEDDIPNVERYLQRTGAMGGGSRSVFKIAKAKFQKAFSMLKGKRQQEVRDTQQHEQKWRNDHTHLRIFSTSCEKTVPARTPRTLPCSGCADLLARKSFKNALRKTPRDPKNYIYTNKEYRNQLLGEIYGRTIVYALLVLGESERVFGHKTRIDLVARALSLGP